MAIPQSPTATASHPSVDLRSYQHDFVHKVRIEYRNGHKAVLLVAATGAGKTVVFSYIAKSAAAKGSRVLILAHRDQLIKQASRKLTDNGVQHGIIMAGFTPNARRLVQVASVQTLVRRVEKMKAAGVGFDLIVIDECLRGDALIDTDVGTIKIENVPTSGASIVRSFDGSEDVWVPIEAFEGKGTRDTLLVKYAGGEIVCTNNHLFYTKSGWKRADQLTPADCLFVSADAASLRRSTDGGMPARWAQVLSVSEASACKVFDIQVAQTHCFYANGVLVHNCHLSAAKSYKDILAAWPEARVLGVTGSPVRLDGKGLGRHAGGSFDTMVQGISIKELIANGYLVKPAVFASKQQIDLSGVKKIGGDYDADAMADLMDKPVITGSAIAEYQKICPGVPAVAWCTNVAHARHVAEEFNAAGIPAMALSGENTSEERDRALQMLSDGRLKLITFAMLLVEGVDCPAIGAVILLRLTMSLSSYLQTIGRGLRPIFAPGMPLDTAEQRFAAIDAGPKGRKCFVIDHCGLWQKHGFADADREWDLDGIKKKKGKKKDDEPKIDLTQCPQCYSVFDPKDRPAGLEHVCPNCGHAIPGRVRKGPEHVDGELAEITPEMEEALRRQKKIEVAGAKTLADLEKIAAQRGYSRGWAQHLWHARQRKNSGKSRAF
jgi:DNA repair protein RadD